MSYTTQPMIANNSVTHSRLNSQHHSAELAERHVYEFKASGITQGMARLNFRSLERGEAIFNVLYFNPEYINTGRLTQKYLKRLSDCEKSPGWYVDGINPLNWTDEHSWGRFKPDKGTPLAWDYQKGKDAKYKSPLGQPSQLFFGRVTWRAWKSISQRYGVGVGKRYRSLGGGVGFWQWVSDHPELPIFLVEGEKKAIALLTHGFIAISAPGIWMARRAEKLDNRVVRDWLVPELEKFCQSDRIINICFDTDIKEKSVQAVRSATQKTGRLIEEKGSQVYVCEIPLLGDAKGAVDDYIFAYGAEQFEIEVVRTAQRLSYFNYLKDREKSVKHKAFKKVNHKSLERLNSLKKLPKDGIIAIRSAKGTGKSKLIGSLIANEPSLALGHRVFLMRELCEKWGLTYREDLDSANGYSIDKHGNLADRVGSCTESLLGISLTNGTLVLDEVDQVLLSLVASSTNGKDGKRPILMGKFTQAIAQAKRVIIASADLTDHEINLIQNIRKRAGVDDSVYLVENTYQPQGYSVEIIDSHSYEPIIERILDDAANGKKLFISTDSRKESKTIAFLIEQLENIGLKCLVINQETSGGEYEQLFIKNINKEVKNWDVVIASPSMSTGVSIETKHFDKVYGIFWGVLSEHDIAQSIGRVRQSVDRVLWVKKSGHEYCKFSRSFYPREIKKSLMRCHEKNLAAIRHSLMPDYNPMLKAQYNWDDNPFLDYYCQRQARKNFSMKHLRENVGHLLKLEGNQVSYTAPDEDGDLYEETREKVKSVKTEIQTQEYQRIALAPPISKQEASELERKPYLKPEDRAKLQRHKISTFYQADKVDLSLLEIDNKGKLRGRLINLEESLDVDLAMTRDFDSYMRQGKWESGFWVPDLSRKTCRAKMTNIIGLMDYLQPDKHYTDDDLKPLVDLLRKYPQDVKDCLGFSVSEKQNNLWHFIVMCQYMGLKCQTRKQRNKVVEVWIDPKHYDWVMKVLELRRQYRASLEAEKAVSPLLYIRELTPSPLQAVEAETLTQSAIGDESLQPVSLSDRDREEVEDGKEIAILAWQMQDSELAKNVAANYRRHGVFHLLKKVAEKVFEESSTAYFWLVGLIPDADLEFGY